MGKKNGGKYDGNLVFPFVHTTALFLWYNALQKAGLDERDPRTGRRLLHIHSLRKFFRSEIGLDIDLTHALMGHSEYLDDSYVRLNLQEISEAYKKNIDRVSIHAVEDLELRKEINQLKKQNMELKQRVNNYILNTEQIHELLFRIEKLEKMQG